MLTHGHSFIHGCDCCCCAGFDESYQAILDYATLQGYTLPSEGQQELQNQHLIELKSAGIWDKLDIYYVFATDGDRNFAKINWKSPAAHYMSEFNSITFTANQGFTGNGSNMYLSTNFNPTVSGVNYLLNNASRYMYARLAGTGIFYDGTLGDTSTRLRIGNTANNSINGGGDTFNTAGNNSMKSIHRTSSNTTVFFNNITQTNGVAVSTSRPNDSQTVLRSTANYANCQLSNYAMGASLVAENTAFVNSFNTYVTSI